MEIAAKRFNDLTLDELYDIIQARIEVFVMEQNILYQDLDGIDHQSTHLFIKEGENLAAYLRIIDAGVKYPEVSIGRVLTMMPYRRKGLSRILMQEAIRLIRETYSGNIKIEAQAYLEDFYKSIGFESVSRPFILEGIPHVSMILKPDLKD